jgi:hypothetical protein
MPQEAHFKRVSSQGILNFGRSRQKTSYFLFPAKTAKKLCLGPSEIYIFLNFSYIKSELVSEEIDQEQHTEFLELVLFHLPV